MIKTSPSDPEDSETFRSGIGLARDADEEGLDLESESLRARLRSKMFGVEALPVKVGRFAILGTLGSGGMGVVYAAYDDELDRKVAVKLLHRSGRADRVERERLLREAQALAKLSHPNVVQVYEAGTHEGRVFVAMEYVGGPTLRTWSDGRTRGWREVVGMYLQAGRGLAAAHKAGIIHRDFKPSNLLLGDDDRVRVVDFGLARASGAAIERIAADETSSQDSALTKELTQTGEVMGTPAYMSPEHISMRTADARSDQFSFCVALFEALFGRRPHRADGTAELLMAIADGEIAEAPRGSGVPRRIVRAVMRGLSTDPADRFESVEVLLAELEPRPARTGLVIGGAGIVLGAVFAGYVVASPDPCEEIVSQLDGVWDDNTSRATEDAFAATGLPFATKAWEATRSELDTYAERWTNARAEACKATYAEGSDRLHDLRVACLDRRRQKLAALTRLFTNADADTVGNAHEAAGNLPRVEACADLDLLQLGIQPPRPADAIQVGVVRGQIDHAGSLNAAGRFQEALGVAEQAVVQARELEYDPALAEALYEVGRAHEELNTAGAAADSLLEAADLAEASRHDELSADIWTRLVLVSGFTASDLEAALAVSRRADSAIRRIEDDPLRRAALSVNLGRVHAYRADRTSAQEEFRRALAGQERELGPEHPTVLLTKARLADALVGEGAGDEALRLHQTVLERLEADLGEEHPRSAGQHVSIGFALVALGRFDDARRHYERALPVYATAYGAGSLKVADLNLTFADLEAQSGHLEDALRYALAALEIQDAQLPREHRDRATTLGLLGVLYQRNDELEKAAETYREYVAIRDNQKSLDDVERIALLSVLINAGFSSQELERCDEARRSFLRALEHIEALGDGHRLLRAAPLHGLGECDFAEGQLEDAERRLQESLSLADSDPSMLRLASQARFALARLARAKGEEARALELARKAERDLASLGHDEQAAEKRLFIEGK